MKIKYSLKLLTPAITAETGTIGKTIDVEMKRDVNGTPYFSAKHIKGIFREKTLEFKNALNENGEEFINKYFGNEGNNPSKIRFSNLELKIDKNEYTDEYKYKKIIENKIGDRYGIKINRKTRVAEDNSLFNYEFVKSNNIFCGELEISENLDEKDLKFLLSSFLHVDRIGGLKSRGLGKVEIRFISIEINNKKEDFKNGKNRFETVGEILKIVSENKPKDGEDKNNEKLEGRKEYKFTLIPLEPLVLQGKVNKNEVEIRKSLQGSTIRGAIIQYGLDNGYGIEDLRKVSISEVKKYRGKVLNGEMTEGKEEFKLASGFETKYPVNGEKKKVDKAISMKKDWKVENDSTGEKEEIKLERGSIALLRSTGTEISVKIDEKTRTTKESFLFSTEYTDLTEKKYKDKDEEKIFFQGNIEIPEGLFEIEKEYELKIGKYKTKGFGKVLISFKEEIQNTESSIIERIKKLNKRVQEDFENFKKENSNKEDEEKEKISDGDKFLEEKKQILITVDFLSDMILPFNQIENVGKEILQLFEGLENELKLNTRRTFVNVEKLRGFNIVNNMRKMDEIVITQGSVISYCVDVEKFEKAENIEIKEEILEGLIKIEKEGIGLRRNEGFGRVRICSERKFDK